SDKTARVSCLWQLVGNCHGRFTEQRWADPVVDERPFQRDGFASVAGWRRKRSEVAGQHRCRRNEGFAICRVLADRGALITAEEKEFVLFDWTAERSSKLIALQCIVCGLKKIPCVEKIVADELEQVAVKVV